MEKVIKRTLVVVYLVGLFVCLWALMIMPLKSWPLFIVLLLTCYAGIVFILDREDEDHNG